MRKPLPSAIANAPALDSTAEYYYEAFNDLHTCRPYEGGRISWQAIDAYAMRYGINDPNDYTVRDTFERIIRKVDDEFLIFMAERAKVTKGKGAGHGKTHDVRQPRGRAVSPRRNNRASGEPG